MLKGIAGFFFGEVGQWVIHPFLLKLLVSETAGDTQDFTDWSAEFDVLPEEDEFVKLAERSSNMMQLRENLTDPQMRMCSLARPKKKRKISLRNVRIMYVPNRKN
ncbi:hypothetical protein NPIL_531941 [Nephila pilipes]|uniref:Uncharacterized protein n=1 Tax=Nephila pilipes TaxID=299642 RepID=A0A8X6PPN3_NEPPI|nr:hypothetical protein NPIL_531941 [Nephila pilipes]